MSQGEGSRGGHITGHTKSGAPIYGTAKDTAAKVDQGKTHSSTAKTISRGISVSGGAIYGLGLKHAQWGVKTMQGLGARNPGKIIEAAALRSMPLTLGGIGATVVGNLAGGYAAEKESKDRGESELTQSWENLKEQVFEGVVSGAATYGTMQAYDALKKVGPGIRRNTAAAAKVTKYAGLKAAQFAMKATRGIRNYAKFVKATPFATQAFTAASRFLTHIK